MRIEDYEERIPAAHRYPRREGEERSRFAEFLLMCLRQGIENGNLLESFPEAFDLDLAVGKQLDCIGAIVGADRVLPFAVVGFDGVLGDDDYRLLIRAKIAANMWDGTNESLARILRDVFSKYGFSFEDSQNMTFAYQIRGDFSDIQIQMIRGDLIAPRPAGIGVEYRIISTAVNTQIYTDTRLGSDFQKASMEQEVE